MLGLLSFLSKVEGKRLVHNAVELFLADAGGKVFLVNRRFDLERRSRGFFWFPVKLAGQNLFGALRGQLSGIFPQQDSLSLIDLVLIFRKYIVNHLLFLFGQKGELYGCHNRELGVINSPFQRSNQLIDAEIVGYGAAF